MKLLVLGWDALDDYHIQHYGLEDAFGTHRKLIETFTNPHIDAPHTRELWPSMITGCHPDEHGVWAATGDDGVDWDNVVLNTAASVANGIIPKDLLTHIGALLREQGVGLSSKQPPYYRDAGTPTVFDDVGGRAISIPNYETKQDARLGFDANRDSLWAAIDADKTRDEHAVHPQVDRNTVDAELGRRLGERVGATMAAIQAGEPLVWTWFGLLDSIGHIQPALGDDWHREWYQQAAATVDGIRSSTDEDTVVMCVSDHGIRDGEHTEYATVACDTPGIIDGIDHVFDVADVIRGVELDAGPRLGVDEAAMQGVQDDLEALGYIET